MLVGANILLYSVDEEAPSMRLQMPGSLRP